jgi:hypothetical protein
MLVTLHLYTEPGPQAPLLHLQRFGDDGLFDQFAGHLQTTFTQASEPLEPDPTVYRDAAENSVDRAR